MNKYVKELEKKAERQRMQPFTVEEYEKMKKDLKCGKAPDLQGWRYEIVKYAGEDLDRSMLTMINEQ